MIRRVLTIILLAVALLPQAISAQPASTEAIFQRDIRPLLNRYCLACHSAAQHTGDVNLQQFASFNEVVKHPLIWQKVVEQLNVGEMPPKTMPQPSADERTRLINWVNSALSQAALKQAGDPGPVVLRRLNNAEYTFTIRDLTGVASLEPAKEFPADGAAGEGFMNTGNALAISPSLVTKYLDAGKAIASHAVLLPDGIRFSSAASRRDLTDETMTAIRAFYQEFTESGGAETVTQQGIALDKNRGGGLPLRRYLLASLALRTTSATTTVDSVARQNKLSAKYLAALINLLKSSRPSPLLDGLRARWRNATPTDVDGMVMEIARWQNALWKFSSVGHIGKVDGPKAWMEPVNPVVEQQEFRLKLAAPPTGKEVTVYLTASDAGDGAANDVVVWHEPKLVIPGRPPVLLRDLTAYVNELTERRTRMLSATEQSLLAADQPDADSSSAEARQAWFSFLGINTPANLQLNLLTKKIEKTGTYDFVQGWGSPKFPMLLANASNQQVRVPGIMKPHAVAVHPSQSQQAAVGWLSPAATALKIEGAITRANPECGAGVTWSLELRRGNARQQLAKGEARNTTPVPLRLDRVRVLPGDLLSVLIGPRDGNFSCALTDLEFDLTDLNQPQERWSLRTDVSANILAANPNGPWHFYTEPVSAADGHIVLPAGSILARWQLAETPQQRRQLAAALQTLLTAEPPPSTDTTPDAALYRQLTSLGSPLFTAPAATAPPARKAPPSVAWGLGPALFGNCDDAASICVQAPSVVAVRLPSDLVSISEFVTTGMLDKTRGLEGSVQLQVLTAKPTPSPGLLLTGATVGDAKGQWSSNNQTIAVATPVIVNAHSAARKRVEADFDQFLQMFPAALCYTKLVPVDEVVTLTQFYREDDALSRLILTHEQKARLDKLWSDLHYVSRDALTLVDAFEQLWQFATQDADPSKFEPMRQPIQARAEAFRQQLIDSQPRHVHAVVDFADRAYRRPLTTAEKDQLRALYRQLRQQELPHEDSIRLMIARVLVAPAFLYRTENVAAGKLPAPVTDYELTSRLSYFLWSSQPDAELRAAAASGKLRTTAELQKQTHRMLRDERVRRMGTEFGAAWLHLHGFDTLDEKSERHFPTFRELRAAMYEEPIRFFADFFSNNGSILSLLNADHSFLNEALARHYGIPGINGPEWRRVDGIGRYARGGILGQAAVLAKQAGASRTSPILRGNWIMEVLLGEKLPRPPKDVPQLPTDEATETLTVRQLTEKHTSDPRCSACHARIDPFGYTLERFDAIGRYREKDLGNRLINDRAKVKDGAELNGVEGLRNYLLTTGRDRFVRQFCRKLLGYSLGRAVQLADEPLLNEMQSRLAATGFHVQTAIDMIVASRQFREIRGRDYEQQQE